MGRRNFSGGELNTRRRIMAREMAKRYTVNLTGETPLLMHQDNLAWEDVMVQWRKDPANKKASVAGDDRSPAFRWIGNLYIDNGMVVVPADNLMTLLREGGNLCPTGGGMGKKKSYKAATQSGIVVDQAAWPLLNRGKTIAYKDIIALKNNKEFGEHVQAVADMGFELFVKRARIGQAKHVRVRPRFDSWACSGTLTVLDDSITLDVLRDILTFAGTYCGMCDWRPSSPKSPGPWGKFNAKVEVMK